MLRPPLARRARGRRTAEGRRVRALAGFAFAAAVLAAGSVSADQASVPGGASHAPERIALPERVRSLQPATLEAEGLYAYTTPFAEPRWLRLQQDGDDLWGTIDINGPFGFCARTSIVGWVSGDEVTFDVDLTTTPCPCSGTSGST